MALREFYFPSHNSTDTIQDFHDNMGAAEPRATRVMYKGAHISKWRPNGLHSA